MAGAILMLGLITLAVCVFAWMVARGDRAARDERAQRSRALRH